LPPAEFQRRRNQTGRCGEKNQLTRVGGGQCCRTRGQARGPVGQIARRRVARHGHRAGHHPGSIVDHGKTHFHVQRFAIFLQCTGDAGTTGREDVAVGDRLVKTVPVRAAHFFRHDQVDALTDRLVRAKAEEDFGAAVPGPDDALEIGKYHGFLHAGENVTGNRVGCRIALLDHVNSCKRLPR
jgi:hypothetical protein